MTNILKALYEALKDFFAAQNTNAKYNPPAKEFRNKRVLEFAAREIGVKEWAQGSNPKVEEYHAYASLDNNEKLKDDVPWCASFVCYCLEKVGMGSTNSRAARSFLQWGRSSRKKPWPGDVVVFFRGDRNGWMGHTGFFVKEDNNFIYVLGGNQSDSVNITRYGKDKLLDIRRSSKHRALTEVEEDALFDMADRLLKTGKVQPEGSVS